MTQDLKRKQLFSEMLWASVKKTVRRNWMDHDELLDALKKIGYPERVWDGLIEGIDALPYIRVEDSRYSEPYPFPKDAGLKATLIALLEGHSTEMEGYSYFGSNPGIPEADFEDVADEFLSSLSEFL